MNKRLLTMPMMDIPTTLGLSEGRAKEFRTVLASDPYARFCAFSGSRIRGTDKVVAILLHSGRTVVLRFVRVQSVEEQVNAMYRFICSRRVLLGVLAMTLEKRQLELGHQRDVASRLFPQQAHSRGTSRKIKLEQPRQAKRMIVRRSDRYPRLRDMMHPVQF